MNWILLIVTLSADATTARMRIWRAIKASGAAVLRDGVYLLPAAEEHRAVFAAVAADARSQDGTAFVLDVAGGDSDAFNMLFDRSSLYADFVRALKTGRREFTQLPVAEAGRWLGKQRKLLEQITAIDFFPGQARLDAALQLQQFEAAFMRRQAPDEPQAQAAVVTPRKVAAYKRRIWATRRRPGIDRLASAWLILRYIDAKASFQWLPKPYRCPKGAVGFDFDGAEFTHTDDYVTFETLLASFDLQQPALQRLAAVVHALDVGGARPPEADGLERIIEGCRSAIANDDELLQAMLPIFDGLLAAFSKEPSV